MIRIYEVYSDSGDSAYVVGRYREYSDASLHKSRLIADLIAGGNLDILVDGDHECQKHTIHNAVIVGIYAVPKIVEVDVM